MYTIFRGRDVIILIGNVFIFNKKKWEPGPVSLCKFTEIRENILLLRSLYSIRGYPILKKSQDTPPHSLGSGPWTFSRLKRMQCSHFCLYLNLLQVIYPWIMGGFGRSCPYSLKIGQFQGSVSRYSSTFHMFIGFIYIKMRDSNCYEINISYNLLEIIIRVWYTFMDF